MARLSLWIFVILASLCCCLPGAYAQPHYAAISDAQWGDNTANCVPGSAANLTCLIPMPSARITQVSPGFDGTVYGITSAGVVKRLVNSTETLAGYWVSTSLPAVHQIAVQDKDNIYALISGGGCALPNYAIYKANSAKTGWTQITTGSGCLSYLAVATSDGTIGGVNASGIGNVLKPGATSWLATPVPTTVYAQQFTILNSGLAFILRGAQVVKWNLTTNTTSDISGVNGFGTISVDQVGVLWLTGTSNSLYKSDLNVTTPALTRINGVVSSVITAGPYFTFGFNANKTVLYHYNSLAPWVTVTTSGYYDCSNMPQGCPAGSVHTVTSKLAFQSMGAHGTAGVTASVHNAPGINQVAQASEYASGCDLIFGNPNSPECKFLYPSTQGE